MKLFRTIALVAYTLEFSFSMAQTAVDKDKELNKKFWIYRDRLRKRFVNRVHSKTQDFKRRNSTLLN